MCVRVFVCLLMVWLLVVPACCTCLLNLLVLLLVCSVCLLLCPPRALLLQQTAELNNLDHSRALLLHLPPRAAPSLAHLVNLICCPPLRQRQRPPQPRHPQPVSSAAASSSDACAVGVCAFGKRSSSTGVVLGARAWVVGARAWCVVARASGMGEQVTSPRHSDSRVCCAVFADCGEFLNTWGTEYKVPSGVSATASSLADRLPYIVSPAVQQCVREWTDMLAQIPEGKEAYKAYQPARVCGAPGTRC